MLERKRKLKEERIVFTTNDARATRYPHAKK